MILSGAKAQSFCGRPTVADAGEAPMNGYSPYFGEHPTSNPHERGRERGGQDNSMRNVIYAINITLDGLVTTPSKTTPSKLPTTKYLNTIRSSCEMLTGSFVDARLIN